MITYSCQTFRLEENNECPIDNYQWLKSSIHKSISTESYLLLSSDQNKMKIVCVLKKCVTLLNFSTHCLYVLSVGESNSQRLDSKLFDDTCCLFLTQEKFDAWTNHPKLKKTSLNTYFLMSRNQRLIEKLEQLKYSQF